MITQTITELPIAPSTSDPVNFRTRGDAFLTSLNGFDDEMNTVIEEINTTAQTINDAETATVQAKDAAVASANFQGTWINQTTQVGQSWYYNGVIYRVLIAGNTSPTESPSNWVSIATASDALLALINQKANTTDVNTALGNKADKASTLAGYGITNAYTKTEVDSAVDALKDVATNTQSASYTLALTDRGKSIDTSAGVTVPLNSTVAFPIGTVITITNTSAAAITLTQTAGVTLRQAGTANTGNRTLAAYGMATLRKTATDTWFISGAGLS